MILFDAKEIDQLYEYCLEERYQALLQRKYTRFRGMIKALERVINSRGEKDWKSLGKTYNDEFIYFIYDTKLDQIKIGKSVDPISRITSIKISSGRTIKPLGVIRSGFDHEFLLHALFAETLVGYEWFKSSPRLLSLINTYSSPISNLISPSRKHNIFGIPFHNIIEQGNAHKKVHARIS